MAEKKKNRIVCFFSDNSTCLISFLLVGFFMLLFMIRYNVSPFGHNSFLCGDAFHQIYPLLAVLHDKLRRGDNIFYYWNSGFGGDYLSAYSYYISSPLNLLVCLFEKKDISSFISFTIALKIVLSAGTFGYFISRRNGCINNKSFYVALSCCYALSTYICSYYFQTMWLDCIVIFPIIMLGYERMINERKFVLYTLSLAFSLVCNYYLSFMICVFLCLWFLIDEYKEMKEFLKKAIRFMSFSFLSACLSAVILIPSYIGLTKTVSASAEVVEHKWYGNIFEVVRNMFILSTPKHTSYNNNAANIYCGSIVILFIFVYLFINQISIQRRIKMIALILFLLISMDEEILNFIWHGFHLQHQAPNRFGFLFVFFVLVVSAECLDNISGNVKAIVLGLLFAIVLPILSYFFVDYDSIIISKQIIILSECLFVSYTIILGIIAFNNNTKKEKWNSVILSIIVVCEIFFNALLVLNYDLTDLGAKVLLLNKVENTYASIAEPGVYRTEVSGSCIDNENAYYGMKGISIFNSTVNGWVPDFMCYMGAHIGYNRINNSYWPDYINDMFGLKYIYSYDEINKNMNNDYEKIYSDNLVKVYSNKDALSLGYGVSDKLKSYSFQDDYDISKNVNLFASDMIEGTEILELINPQYQISYSGCEVGLGETDYFCLEYKQDKEAKEINISFSPPEKGKYYIDVREINEDYITLKVNGQLIEQSMWMTNGLNLIGEISPNDKVDLIISDNNGVSYQENEMYSLVRVLLYRENVDNLEKFIATLKSNQMSVEQINDNKLKGSVNLSANQILFTSIPYDNGWHVYENGKELKTIKLASTFLGVDAGEGYHELEFVYIPDGFYLGCAVSCITLFIFMFVFIIYKRKYNDKQRNDSDDISDV